MPLPFPGRGPRHISPIQKKRQKESRMGLLDFHVTPYEELNRHVHSLREIIIVFLHKYKERTYNVATGYFLKDSDRHIYK